MDRRSHYHQENGNTSCQIPFHPIEYKNSGHKNSYKMPTVIMIRFTVRLFPAVIQNYREGRDELWSFEPASADYRGHTGD